MPELTRDNARVVLGNVIDQIEADPERAAVWCFDLNVMMDEMLVNDFFGTEGQSDPRGDHRG
jgi:hypothetical protein